jgi:LysM repeat protein
VRIIICLFAGCWLVAGCGQIIAPTSAVTVAQTSATPSAYTVTPTSTPQPTSTPRPATPIASSTPTVTPTPVIYTIQSGDTLLDVAIRFDTSPEAIQDANGIVDPRLLQIGQELIIPPPVGDPADPATPTPTPPPLAVEAISFLETRQGALWCLGKVRNPGAEALSEVVVEASLFDSGGVLLAREAAFIQLDVIPSGEAIPFAVLFDSPPSSFAQYHVAAVSGIPITAQARYYFDLEAFDLQGAQIDVSTYRLRGQLRNTGLYDAQSIRLVAVVYNTDDKVLAQRQAELSVELLKAGAITPFEMDLIVPHGVVEHYEVMVQALTAE